MAAQTVAGIVKRQAQASRIGQEWHHAQDDVP